MAEFETLNQMLRWFQARERLNYTTDVLVEGPRGAGKSNDVLLMMNQLQPGFPFDRHYVYDAVDLARVLPLTHGLENVKMWFDEAKNLVYRRQAMTRVNKAVSTLMSQIREKKGTRFWVSPDSGELEDFLTKDQADVCLTAPRRGSLIAWRFWKNWNAPPGHREGRWVKAFTRDHIPDVSLVKPELGAAYRRWKTAGYERVSQGTVDKILLAEKHSSYNMSIGRRGLPPSRFSFGHQKLRELAQAGGRAGSQPKRGPPLHAAPA